MADSALASLPAVTALDGSEFMYAIQGGIDKKISPQLVASILTSTALTTSLAEMTGNSDQTKSVALQRADAEDNAAYIEPWADLSQVTLTAAGQLQVSGGRLYAGATAQNGSSAANHALVVPTTGVFRITTSVTLIAGGSGGIAIGVSKDAAGAAPAINANSAQGIYFDQSGAVQVVNLGVSGNLGTWTAGTYQVTIAGDGKEISAVAQKIDGSLEFSTVIAQAAGFPINNVYVLCSDTRQLTGSSIGPLAARKAFSSFRPASVVEATGRTIIRGTDGTNNFRLSLPAVYDSRRPVPLIVCFHGQGTGEQTWAPGGADSNYPLITTALNNAGYAVLSAAAAGLSTWGNASAVAAYAAAYQWVKTKIAFSSVAVLGNSMGGIESLNTIARAKIPGVCAWVGTSPTFSLADNYGNANFTSIINSAYGISGDYAAKTAGYDPALLNPQAWGGIPMMVLTATDDATVHPVQNGQALASYVAGVAREVNAVSGITGGHSFSITPYLAQIVAFLGKYVS